MLFLPHWYLNNMVAISEQSLIFIIQNHHSLNSTFPKLGPNSFGNKSPLISVKAARRLWGNSSTGRKKLSLMNDFTPDHFC